MVVFIGSLMASAMAKSYKAKFDSVDRQMSELYKHIGDVQAIASSSGHSDIQKKCSDAKQALDSAQSSWQHISTTYVNRPWLASENSLSSTIKSRLSDCGSILKEIQEHSEVQSNTNAYSGTLQACQTKYTNCVSSCDGIWNWQPPAPQPSSVPNRKLRRSLSEEQVPACPNNETACPISPLSFGFECIDTNLELASCGGCATKGEGENCLSIVGAAGVGCLEGRCVVFSAESGYYLGQQGRPLRRRRMV